MSSIEDKKWNKMWELWADEELESPLSDLLTYEAEIQNGGHLQYFANLSSNEADWTCVTANLKQLLTQPLFENYQNALNKFKELNLNIETIEDFSDAANDEPLNEFDDFYYENENTIEEILKEAAKSIEL